MLSNILEIEGVNLLSKDQQKDLTGGGDCAVRFRQDSYDTNGNYLSSTWVVSYGVSASNAESIALDFHGQWCCQHCNQAPWYEPPAIVPGGGGL